MKAVVQRVSSASVKVDGRITGSVERGLLVLLGIAPADTKETARWMADKIAGLRIFSDTDGKMNLSANDIGGGLLVVSNFTLYGNAQKGFRPSFTEAAAPEKAAPLYDYFLSYLHEKYSNLNICSGVFGAMMDVALVNEGPVTIILEK
ncbi:D-aminoacyl-tRNA deacylase [Ignavibacteria bacterium]|nr:D-tyrosyl-tRNA(Tyr) deacylase [Bacteroidota bacterium]MCZ2132957.1 D-tyrosyl-tRNA(Tyr) deacylase [Bacteroidota bacterium]